MNITLDDIKPIIESQITWISISMRDITNNNWEIMAKNIRNMISGLIKPLREFRIIYDYNVTYSVKLNYDDNSKDDWTSAIITFVIGLKNNPLETEFNRDWTNTLYMVNKKG